MPKRVRERVQTWPMKVINQAMTIKSQNELLLLDLLLAYKELKRGDAGRLKECLPELKRLIGVIYQAAEEVDGTFSHKRGNSPVWLDVSLAIEKDYPDTRTRLATIEQKLGLDAKPSGHLLNEIRKDLIFIINKVAGIHVDILRIPIPKNRDDNEDQESFEEPAILDINSLNLIRKSGEFKTPNL